MESQVFRPDLLRGKVALITGGATGIGAAIARELGRLGATVAIASRKTDVITRAAAHLNAELPGRVIGLTCNIRKRDSVAAAVEQLMAETGRVDFLVNNGGGQFMAPAEMITPRGWDAVVETNLTGTWTLTRAVADAWMLGNGGRIINITMLTQRGFPGMTHSVAARAGVEAMGRTLAVEWAQRGICINAIAPGIIASSGLLKYPEGQTLAESMQSEIPAKRLGTCDEIAWMVAFLCSPAGAYITGQTLVIDGGRTMWGRTWPIPDPDELPAVTLSSEPWQE